MQCISHRSSGAHDIVPSIGSFGEYKCQPGKDLLPPVGKLKRAWRPALLDFLYML